MKMGQLYKEMGFVNTGHTVQATRADLVGQYIGHTGPKTKEMITRSFGGILFIDEAYGLYKEDSRDYGSEVIEMLVKFIDMTENKDFVLVLAGYRNLMTRMLNANLNLMSRMGNWIDFPDYDGEELNQISGLLARDYGYTYPPEARWEPKKQDLLLIIFQKQSNRPSLTYQMLFEQSQIRGVHGLTQGIPLFLQRPYRT